MAEQHNFNIDQGTTWNRTITLTEDDDTPIDLTGFTARMQLRRSIQSPDVVLSMTTENGTITISMPLLGEIGLDLSAAQTASLAGTYYYDLELVNGDEVSRIIQGKVIVSQEVTR